MYNLKLILYLRLHRMLLILIEVHMIHLLLHLLDLVTLPLLTVHTLKENMMKVTLTLIAQHYFEPTGLASWNNKQTSGTEQ